MFGGCKVSDASWSRQYQQNTYRSRSTMAVWLDGLRVLRFDELRPVTLIVVPLRVAHVQQASFVHQRTRSVLSRDGVDDRCDLRRRDGACDGASSRRDAVVEGSIFA